MGSFKAAIVQSMVAITLVAAFIANAAQGQPVDDANASGTAVIEGETRYITDLIFTPVRTGPGGDYRIVNKGLPSGTSVTYFGTTDDGVWAEVETRGGTRGYLRAQYLQTETPRATQINTLQSQLAQSNERAERLSAELNDVQARLTSISSEAGSAEQVLSDTQAELAEIKRISSNAMQLDQLTKELSAKIENVTSQNDLLLLENARLGDRVASNQRLEGVLFLVAGIVIALVLPRLTAKRRRPGGWR